MPPGLSKLLSATVLASFIFLEKNFKWDHLKGDVDMLTKLAIGMDTSEVY